MGNGGDRVPFSYAVDRAGLLTGSEDFMRNAGIVSQEQSENVNVIPRHLKPYKDLLEEQDRIAAILQKNSVPTSILTTGTVMACKAMHGRGEHKEALELMVSHMKKMAEEHGVSI